MAKRPKAPMAQRSKAAVRMAPAPVAAAPKAGVPKAAAVAPKIGAPKPIGAPSLAAPPAGGFSYPPPRGLKGK
jgi:hypothetical protein